MFSLPVLEDQLAHYVNGSTAEAFENPFDFSDVPVITCEQSLAEDRKSKLNTATPTLKAPTAGPKKVDAANAATTAAAATVASQKYASALQAVPEFASYGGVLKSSPIVELTESETEYLVSAIKHLFKSHIVLQFDVKNTVDGIVLSDVSVISTPSSENEDISEEFIIPTPLLKTDEPGTVYVSFERPTSPAFIAASFTNVLKFTIKEIDPSTGEPEESGYEDEYQIEDLELTGADYVVPAFAGSFDNIWTSLASADEAEETLALEGPKGIADAVELLVKSLGMQPLDGSDVALSGSTHTLKLYGKSVTGGKVASLIRMAYSVKSGVTVKINARAEEDGLAALIVGGVA